MQYEEGDDVGDRGGAKTVCIGVEEAGEAAEDAVDSGAGGGVVWIWGGGGLEPSWLAEEGRGIGGTGERGAAAWTGLPEKLAQGHYIWN